MLKLGTRKSLLAWAQSSWVARELERLNPGVKVELVGIETRGDRILDVPLQSVQGKEFFVAEIDDALRSRAVDLTVHSMKDLSLDRPPEFVLGANPRRENPRDVIIFGPSVEAALRSGRVLKIGTSSPRRLENIPGFLKFALPRLGQEPKVNLLEIRGNVNTRLSRVQEPEGSERHLDGVVLAFAGLIRLWADEKGRAELSKLFVGTRWMILPLKECPAAPAQGALAVECRKDDKQTREILAKLHDAATAAEVSVERQLLADWGGGCHQKFGATAIAHPELGELLYIRGKKPDQTFVDELRWRGGGSPRGTGKAQCWDGSEWRARGGSEPVAVNGPLGDAIFVAHWRAAISAVHGSLKKTRIWVSGSASWFKLAEQGLWVEGSAEGLGFDLIAPTLSEKVLRLPGLRDWTVLTHTNAQGWSGPKVVATYEAKPEYSDEARQAARSATHFYWSSLSQFDELGGLAGKAAEHACGPGKTAAHLRSKGLNPRVFPSVEEWKRWLQS